MSITVRKLKSGKPRYVVRIRDDFGRYYPSKSFDTRREADFYERRLKERKDRKDSALSSFKRKILIKDYFEEWLEYREGSISKGWHMKVKQAVRIHVLPLLGELRLCNMRTPLVGKVLRAMEKKSLSASSRKIVYHILNQAFRDSVDYFSYLEKNPVLKQDKPKLHKTQRNFLKPQDTYKLLDQVSDHYLGPAIYLGAFVGLRPSEIQALKWKSVDFERGQILVCSAFKKAVNKIEDHPKQKDWLIVPIPLPLAAYLKKNKRQASSFFCGTCCERGDARSKQV